MAVAAPASFSVLAKLDKKWNYGEYLNRLVINFSKVSDAVWDKISLSIPLIKHVDHLFLSFIVLTTGGTICALAINWFINSVWELEPTEIQLENEFWGYFSVASLFLIALALGVTKTLLVFATFSFLTPFTLCIIVVSLWSGRKKIWHTLNSKGLWVRKVVFVITFYAMCSILYIEAEIGLELLASKNLLDTNLTWSTAALYYSLTLLVLFAIGIVWTMNLKGPTMVLVFSIGVLSIDFLDRNVRPSLETFFTDIETNN